MLIVLKNFQKFNGQKNNQQSSLKGEKVEINPHLILLVQMTFQIHLIFPLNLFRIYQFYQTKRSFVSNFYIIESIFSDKNKFFTCDFDVLNMNIHICHLKIIFYSFKYLKY
jgi:hypothetical protein